MPRTTLSPELKKAISAMPSKEKDKLLYRLIAKDQMLVRQLEFKLLEGSDTMEERREELKAEMTKAIAYYAKNFYSPGYLLMDLRGASGVINKHVKITKDKYGEIALNFHMLNTTFELLGERIKQFPPNKCYTFNAYVVSRTLKLLKLLGKLHEDYQLDFKEDMQQLGEYIGGNHYLMKEAIRNMLDVNWLSQGEVPEEFR